MSSASFSIVPSSILLQSILPFLSIKETLRFDSAMSDKSYREEVSRQLTNYVNSTLSEESIGLKAFEWLVKREAVITRLNFRSKDDKAALISKLPELLSACNDTMTELSFDITPVKAVMAICPSLRNLELFRLIAPRIHACLRDFWPLHPALKHVALSGDLRRNSEVVRKLAENCAQLVFFELNSNINDRDIDAIATHCPMLERVYLEAYISRYDLLTTDTLTKLVTNCVRLRHLCLSGFVHLSDDTIGAIAPHLPLIEHLNLTGWKLITDASIAILALNCPLFTELTLIGCEQLTDISIVSIVEHCHHLQSIDITQCPLVTKAGYLQLKTIPTLTAITMLDYRRTAHVVNPHRETGDETGFANLLQVVEIANKPYVYSGDIYASDDEDDYGNGSYWSDYDYFSGYHSDDRQSNFMNDFNYLSTFDYDND